MVDEFLKILENKVVTLVNDSNGHHIIQKALSSLKPEQNQFIFDEIESKVMEVAMHKQGCCVMQRCIDFTNNEQRVTQQIFLMFTPIKEKLAMAVVKCGIPLVQDQYGNYVVQYILEQQGLEDQKHEISEILSKHILNLSKQKFSSNVLEKCVKLDIGNFRSAMFEVLQNPEQLPYMITDEYANYGKNSGDLINLFF